MPMSEADKLRIQVLELENRVNALTTEVIQGRTEIAEKVDHLSAQVTELRDLVLEMPKLIVQIIADVAKDQSKP